MTLAAPGRARASITKSNVAAMKLGCVIDERCSKALEQTLLLLVRAFLCIPSKSNRLSMIFVRAGEPGFSAHDGTDFIPDYQVYRWERAKKP